MSLRIYRNKTTGEEKRSLKKLGDEWEETIVAPNQKFMVTANKGTGTSKLKDSEKALRARSRNQAREVDIDHDIQFNRANGLNAQVANNLLNSKGERRKKVDDL
jgi:hypothetical protein